MLLLGTFDVFIKKIDFYKFYNFEQAENAIVFIYIVGGFVMYVKENIQICWNIFLKKEENITTCFKKKRWEFVVLFMKVPL